MGPLLSSAQPRHLVTQMTTGPPGPHHRAEETYWKQHFPPQPFPIALHRQSANNFFCVSFENEVRKTNYPGQSDRMRVLKESEETGGCCFPLLESCVRKIGHQCYGRDTLRVPDGKCDFFPSPSFSPHSSVLFLCVKCQNKNDIFSHQVPVFITSSFKTWRKRVKKKKKEKRKCKKMFWFLLFWHGFSCHPTEKVGRY